MLGLTHRVVPFLVFHHMLVTIVKILFPVFVVLGLEVLILLSTHHLILLLLHLEDVWVEQVELGHSMLLKLLL